MRIPRIYTETTLGDCSHIDLTGSAANHVSRVLRLKTGDPITLFDGQGHQCDCRIESHSKTSVTLVVDDCETISLESPLAITLIQSISKGERMDWVFQKATELGASRFMPVYSQHSVVKLDKRRLENRISHWRNVITHACEQCGRNHLPLLDTPVQLQSALEQVPTDHCFFLDPGNSNNFSSIEQASEIYLLVGPEGGFSEQETIDFKSRGIRGLNLGPRVLRTETAAIAAVSAIQVLWGDLK